jgi:prepilin-type N-terminal cleavage/methylation domain-containing protein
MKMTPPKKTQRAFTLIEIIVALAILGMVVAGIYSSWIAIARGAKVGLAAAAEAQRSRMAVHTLEQALTSARSFAADLQYYSFVAENGSEASLSFVAKLPESFPRSGVFDSDVRRVTFFLRSGQGSGKELVLQQNELLKDMTEDEKNYPLVLARNVKDFVFGFWDDQKKDWVDEWSDDRTNHIPPLISITLRLTTGDSASSQVNEIVREIAMPAVTVQPVWQSSRGPGGPPGAPPGNLPPGFLNNAPPKGNPAGKGGGGPPPP